MSRLIDADKLKKAIADPLNSAYGVDCTEYTRKLIDLAPTAYEADYEWTSSIDRWHYPSKGEYPPDGEETLIIFKHRGEKVFKVDKYSKQYNGWQFSPKPIAWMPLPEPPQEEV